MIHHAVLIGIDRHADSDIPDLAGARRDALALSASFQDSIPDFDAALLADEGATAEAIRPPAEVPEDA